MRNFSKKFHQKGRTSQSSIRIIFSKGGNEGRRRETHRFSSSKGFVKLLEAIIASIILIASISYFFLPQAQLSSWNDIVLGVASEESLIAMEKSGRLTDYVKSNDVASLNAELRKMLPPNIDFSVEVRAIPNPLIFVECFCTETEESDLKSLLSPLNYNYKGRQIEIRVQRLGDINQINPQTNVLFVIGYENLNPYRTALNNFLGRGGTIFMLADLTQQNVNDGYMNDVFGLRWARGTGGVGRFYDTATPSRASYKIAKYFRGLRQQDPTTALFNGFNYDSSNNNVQVDDKSVVVTSGNPVSYAKTNQFIASSRGRTVWLASYDYTNGNNPNVQEINNLTKAAVMWASGERYKMDEPPNKKPGPLFSEASAMSAIGDEQFEVSLLFWKVFF